MPPVGFELTIAVLERAKTVRALDRADTAIGSSDTVVTIYDTKFHRMHKIMVVTTTLSSEVMWLARVTANPSHVNLELLSDAVL
jgi:hypothetical protein